MPTINYNYYPYSWTATDRSAKIGNINLFHKAATPASWGGRIYTNPSWIQLYARLDTAWWNAYYNNPCGPGSGCSLDLGAILYEFPKETSNVPVDFIPMNWTENSFFEVGNAFIYGQETNDASKRRYWGFFGLVPYGIVYSIDTITGFNIAIPENEDSFCNNSYDLLSGIGRNISTDQRFPYNIPNGILFGISTSPCTSNGGKENFILVVKKDGTLYRGNYQANTDPSPSTPHSLIIRSYQGNTILSIDGIDRITLAAIPSGTLKPLWGIGCFSDTSTYGSYTPSVKLNNINIGTLSPANIISTVLTVDKNDCTELCTVGGNVSWTNTGDVVSNPIDLSITVNGNQNIISSGVTINPGETKSYTFSIPNLTAGTYNICASPDSGTICQIITVRTPANVTSTTLTVDKNDCTEPCTVGGNVSWTNNGETASDPIDLGITVDTVPTVLASGVIIPPSTTTSLYPFSVQNLSAGTHNICASPDSGTTCQIITVNTPANVISTTLTVDKTDCTEPCTVGGNVSWTNNGGIASDPMDLSITVNGDQNIISSGVAINPGETKSYTFSIPNLMAGTYNICASPDSGTICQIITVRTPAHVISATLTVDKNDCTEPCTVGGNVSWTNNGGTVSDPIDLSITVNGDQNIISSGVTIDPGVTTSVYPFSLPDLVSGTYEICASPDSGTTCQIITVRTPANVTSTTLTVDKNICTALCTVSGNVSWTNNGETASGPIDLGITVDTVPTVLATGIIIPPSTTTSLYPFSVQNLPAGTHIICASPDSGVACQTITVNTPADIVTTEITLTPSTCNEPCNSNVDVTYMNSEQTAGDFTPEITVNGVSVTLGVETLDPGISIVKTFALTDKMAGTYTICAVPLGATTCQTLTVKAAQEAGVGILLAGGLVIGALLMGGEEDKGKTTQITLIPGPKKVSRSNIGNN